MAKEFSATVAAWVLKTEGLMEAVFKQSVQDVIEDMQKPVAKGGNMPVDLGFLRNSLRVTIGQPASGFLERPSGYNLPDGEDISYQMTIGGAELGDTIYAVYLASYAVHQEYGARGREGRGFRRKAAQKWQRIVARNVSKVKKQ